MARQPSSFNDPSLLEAALEGLQLQKSRIEAQIEEIRARLGRVRGAGGPRKNNRVATAPARAERTTARKRTLSEAARKRIAAAQKKRWAEFRKTQPKSE